MRLALIGVGLMGGSFALAARAAGLVSRIVGFDTGTDALQRALELGVIDAAAGSAATAVRDASVVMIATRVGAVPSVLQEIAAHLRIDAVVTDVGSTKASVIEAGRQHLGTAFARFVPAHPIAGSERSGVEHADAGVFRGKVVITTPVAQTEPETLDRVESLWRAIGCRVERMTPEEHDQVFAAVSHLPHLLAFALVAHIADLPDAARKFALAGAGFRDFTRIAGSNAEMWSDICVANRAAISEVLRGNRDLLAELQHMIDDGDGAALRSLFLRARVALNPSIERARTDAQ